MALGKTIIIGVTIIITLFLIALLASSMFGGIYNDMAASTPPNTTEHASIEIAHTMIIGMDTLPYVVIVLFAVGLLFTIIGYAIYNTTKKGFGYRR